MTSSKYKNKSTSSRNLIITLGVIISIILIILYINTWKKVKEAEKYLNSYLITTNTISLEMNDINEIHSVLSETPNYYFVYIGYNQDKNVYNFEKKLKPLIVENDLQNSFYFINITKIKENNKNYQKEIANELKISEDYLKKIPVILYFEDGKLASSALTSVKDFENLIKEKNIKLK